MKNILVVINTLGRAGAEMMLVDLLKHMPKDLDVSLFVLTGQGEMVHELPERVHLINRCYDDSSVLNAKGRKNLIGRIFWHGLHNGSILKNFHNIAGGFTEQITHGGLKNVKYDKLLWRVFSDGAPVLNREYDLAVAFLEGGSTYYVADHVKAKRKVAFVHVDYKMAGYTGNLDGNCYDCFDRIYTVSEDVKRSFIDVHPECVTKTEVFMNVPDTGRIIEKASAPLDFKGLDHELGIPHDESTKILVSVMRLSKQKSVDFSARVCRKLLDDGCNIRWYVFGEGEDRKKLEKLVDELGIRAEFILCGSVENPYPYMAACDLYVHLSKFEGKSIALQEALILGRRAVVSDASGNHDVSEDADRFVRVGFDVDEAALCIEHELDHVRQKDAAVSLNDDKNKNRVLILIPARNEGKNIGRLLDEIEADGITDMADVLVINDGSEDATVKEVTDRGCTCIDNISGRGYGSALKAGYKYAFFHGYGHVLQMDADGQHDVSNIRALIKASRKRDKDGRPWDIIIGSRFMEGSVSYPVSSVKLRGVRFFSTVIRLATGKDITDPTSGLQIIRRRAFRYYTLPGRFDDDYPDANILIQMLLAGFKVIEIPAVMHERKEGKSMHSGLKPVMYMLKMSVGIPRVLLRGKASDTHRRKA